MSASASQRVRLCALGCALLLGPLPAALGAPAPGTPEKAEPVVIPLVAYNEETSLQLGGAGILLLPRFDASSLRTSLVASALVSVREQLTASLSGNASFLADTLRLFARLDGSIWPTRFYAQDPGPEEYEAYSFTGTGGEARLAWRLVDRLFAGPSIRFSLQENDVPAGGLMERSGLTSLRGHTSIGPGLSIAFDSRDRVHAPARGAYVGATAHYLFGLDSRTEGFLESKLFARWYLAIVPARDIVAFALELRDVEGDPPFALMPTSDGTTVLRGLRRARYYDRRLAAAQVEYRRMLGRLGRTGPWGVTLFAEAGDFFDEPGSRHRLVSSLGAGLRYFVIPGESVALRLDAAYVDGGVGLVLNALEAF